jgi:hypothetical protein
MGADSNNRALLTVRVDMALRRRIEDAAKSSDRTLNAEAARRLRESFDLSRRRHEGERPDEAA